MKTETVKLKISIDGKTIQDYTMSIENPLSTIIVNLTSGYKPSLSGTFTTYDLLRGESLKLICRKKGVYKIIPVWVGQNLTIEQLNLEYDDFGNLDLTK